MTTIAYDQPIRDFIAGLDATGHVTHIAYRKTSVTFHHNGGRLSLQGILDVWKTREASAHFQVDGQGQLGQYVRVNEYAWATGNTEGNRSSISIEMADATLAPDYLVADVTWRSATRLAGWLFWRVIGAAPTRQTVHLHHDWKSTSCAGPFIDRIREQLFQAVLASYNAFVSGNSNPSPSPATSEEDDMPPFVAYRNDPAQKDPATGRPGNGAVVLAAAGIWEGVESPGHFDLLKAKGACGNWVNLAPNQFAYFRAKFLSSEVNDEEIKKALAGLTADQAARAAQS